MDAWEKVSALVLNVVQVLAIVTGGVWVYFKFVRSRTFARRAELNVEAGIVQAKGRRMIQVTAVLKNAGLAKLPLMPKTQLAILSAIQSDEWVAWTNPPWHELMTT